MLRLPDAACVSARFYCERERGKKQRRDCVLYLVYVHTYKYFMARINGEKIKAENDWGKKVETLLIRLYSATAAY